MKGAYTFIDDEKPDVTPEDFDFECGAFLVNPRQFGKSVARPTPKWRVDLSLLTRNEN